MKFSLLQIRDFINQERIYILMLGVILLLNALSSLAERNPQFQKNYPQEKQLPLYRASRDVKDRFVYPQLKDERRLQNLGSLFILFFSLGLFLDIRILMDKIKKRPFFKVDAAHLLPQWGVLDIFKLAIISVFLGYFLHIIEVLILLLFSKEKTALSFIPLVNAGIIDLAILAFIFYFIKVKYKQNLRVIGLKGEALARNIFLGLLSYIAFLPILTLILLLLIWLAYLFNYQPTPQLLFKLFFQEKNTWFLVYLTVVVVVLGPVVEEIFFRGFTYNALKKRWGSLPAMVLSAVVFAALHGNFIGFLPILALGFLLVYVYEKSGSLIPAITIHILHNFAMVVFLLVVRFSV